MLKAVHVHTDLKFVAGKDSFDASHFDNTVLIIGAPKTDNGPYSDQAVFLSSRRRDLRRAIQICSDADIVVLYGLDTPKSYIAIHLPRSMTIAWRFFGYEIYGRDQETCLSEHSLSVYKGRKRGFFKRLGISLVQYKYQLTQGYSMNTLLEKAVRRMDVFLLCLAQGYSVDTLFAEAVRRVDLFLGLSKHEYDYLSEHWGKLPRFVQLPLLASTQIEENAHIKNNVIIIGNSRSNHNNHLDIIDLIEHSVCNKQLSFVIPFSYGGETAYTRKVRYRIAKSSSNFFLLEDFLAKNAYLELIAQAKAAVFNAYRQMAMGNIFPLLGSGAKVYLNTRNVIYHWFIELGLKVFTIEEFESDLASDTLELDMADRLFNASVLKRLKSEFGRERFADDLAAILKEKGADKFP